MKRRQFIEGISVLSAGSLLFFVQAGEERINDLESNVEILDQRVGALET